MKQYIIWSEDHPDQGEATIEAERGGDAAKEWLEERWGRLGQPDEVRVFVRREDGSLRAYDVHVEEVMLDMTAMRVELDSNGRPPSDEELQKRADEAMERFRAKRAAERTETSR